MFAAFAVSMIAPFAVIAFPLVAMMLMNITPDFELITQEDR